MNKPLGWHVQSLQQGTPTSWPNATVETDNGNLRLINRSGKDSKQFRELTLTVSALPLLVAVVKAVKTGKPADELAALVTAVETHITEEGVRIP